jgi:CRISPR/Cas system CMR-associated protein Cmr5 small subunit
MYFLKKVYENNFSFNKLLYMRKLPISIVILLLTLLLCCSKNQKISVQNQTSTDLALIEKAKNFFDANLENSKNPVESNPATNDFDPVKNILKTPVWNKAYTQKLSFGSAVIVPIAFPSDWHLNSTSMGKSAKIPLNNLYKLIIYQDQGKTYHANVLAFFPDSNFLNQPLGSFSGEIILESWDGNRISHFSYPKTSLLTDNGKQNDAVEPNTAIPELVEEETCTYIDYYSCAGTEEDPYQYCTYSFTQFLGCTPDGGGGGGGGSVSVADGSAVAQGGGSGSAPSAADYSALSRICGSGYNWGTIGSAWYTQFAPMNFQVIYLGDGPLAGTINLYTIQAGCWQLPKARASTKSAADNIVNQAWNYAVSQVPVHLNAGAPVSNASVINAFTADIRNYFLINNYGSSASFNPTGCGGNVPQTPAPAPCDN